MHLVEYADGDRKQHRLGEEECEWDGEPPAVAAAVGVAAQGAAAAAGAAAGDPPRTDLVAGLPRPDSDVEMDIEMDSSDEDEWLHGGPGLLGQRYGDYFLAVLRQQHSGCVLPYGIQW